MFAPKLSAPLTKAIRTSEGILVWATNVVLAAGALVDPSTLPPKEAAVVGSVLTGLHVASRTLVKVTALQQGVGLAAPVPFESPIADELAKALKTVLPQVLADIKAGATPNKVVEQLVSDTEEFAAQPAAAPAAVAATVQQPAQATQAAPVSGS